MNTLTGVAYVSTTITGTSICPPPFPPSAIAGARHFVVL